ncbi:MAG TPA: hypothetical protein DD440_04800 [Porticoccaceae bacterium]|nr:hypothetical protein [Porticoccaceae bacterium]|tara:strand:- start:1437 stop:2996 length:1560 start_codon:yes stop_codon:yes gene_type:complete
MARSYQLSHEQLKDKILGGWSGKAYGCMMGEPMEFKAQGEIYEGTLDIHPKAPTVWLHNEDDMYVNMALLEVMQKEGIDATRDHFARVFTDSPFMLWHANGQARQNLLAGMSADLSGHPRFNPHADDIDFQIECDFIGLISPGLPAAVTDYADRVGHIMNYGEGYYAGVFLASLYAAAFIENDRLEMIEMALQTIPVDCDYALMLRDLLAWYAQEPEDWRVTWQKVEDKWNNDLCPWAKTDAGCFNIQGHFNGVYVLMGILYGGGDYIKSISVCTRCGQDTDSNVGNCGGIMGAIIGYERLPDEVKSELAPYMDRDYNHTTLSNNSATQLCYQLALSLIEKHGGRIGDMIELPNQPFQFVGEREVSFIDCQIVDAYPTLDDAIQWHGDWDRDEILSQPTYGKEVISSSDYGDYAEVKFRGNCIYMQAALSSSCGIVDIYIDGEHVGTRDLFIDAGFDHTFHVQATAVWETGLDDGEHVLKVVVSEQKNPHSSGFLVSLGRVVSYSGKVAELPEQYRGNA